MLAQILGTLILQRRQPVIAVNISLQDFVDAEMDVEGWYAIDHHDPNLFFAAVSQQESAEKLKQNTVEHLWATFDDNHFELFEQALPGAKAVTVIRLF